MAKLVDLKSQIAEQTRIALEQARSPKVQAAKEHDGPAYKAPVMSSFTASKGRNAGKVMLRWRFEHKANPVWSRQYDDVDLALILANIDTAKAALAAMVQYKKEQQ